MRNLILIFRSMALIMLILQVVACSQSVKQRLEPKEFQAKLNTVQNPQIIDVRTSEEFSKGHLVHAININFYDSDFKTVLTELNINQPVFVYCQAGAKGGRSFQAIELLKELQFKEIYELSGGMSQWQKTFSETN